ncbi:hypothetical protein [Pedobacter sp. MW01-1-1]|uniref:hypothetical protein n=1 Tax=Pedobacter sp. MW01-1-1 TaxID=3383027 RepID=UPI003FEFA305
MKNIFFSLKALIVLVLLFFYQPLMAQDDAAELAKKLANPISSLVSVPFQINSDYGIGNLNGSRTTVNFQPVLPLKISKNLNLITRMVLPIVSQYNITGVAEKQSGLSDAVVSAFFSPSNGKNGFTWGAGPAFLVPTATNNLLGSDQFGIGPTVIALKQVNGITIGALANQIWGVSGDNSKPDVNQMFLQPFFNYNWKSGAGIGGNMELTQNWTANTTTLWINPTISAVASLGKQKTQFAIGPRFNVASPKATKADFGWRAVVIFLFPK